MRLGGSGRRPTGLGPGAELDTNDPNVTAAIERQFGSEDVNALIWLLQP